MGKYSKQSKQLFIDWQTLAHSTLMVSLKRNKHLSREKFFLNALLFLFHWLVAHWNISLQDPVNPEEACPGVIGAITHYQISFHTASFAATENIMRCTARRCSHTFEPPSNPPSTYDSVSVAAQNVVGVGPAKTCTTQSIGELQVLSCCIQHFIMFLCTWSMYRLYHGQPSTLYSYHYYTILIAESLWSLCLAYNNKLSFIY